jgi:AcrR family transcriptional regulator
MAATRTHAVGDPRQTPPRSSTAERRRERKREILSATRQLFDERGVNNAQIEDIARAAGINRAIVYRHFASKDEIFAMTLAEYLSELKAVLEEAASRDLTHVERFAATVDGFAEYAMDHPAFIDSAQALTSQRWSELRGEVPEEPLLRLGQLIADCLSIVVKVLDDGTVAGEFRIADPALLANMLYASGLGALQQARLGAYITYGNDGAPIVRPLSRDRVREYLREAALAATRRSRPATD